MSLKAKCLPVLMITALLAGTAEAAAARTATVRIGGTGSALGVMKILADSFEKSHAGVKIRLVPSLGSAGGIKALREGALDIALSGRPLNADEKSRGGRAHEFARSPFVFIANNTVRKESITSGELVRIYGGELSSWPDGSRIRVILRPLTESDTQLLCKISPVMERAVTAAISREGMISAITDQENLNTVAKTTGAIGGSSLTQILSEKPAVKTLSFNGVMPSVKGLHSGSYPLYKSLYLVTAAESSAAAKQFVEFIYSKAGGALLAKYGNQPRERSSAR